MFPTFSRTRLLSALLPCLAALWPLQSALAETACATVKIVIEQQVTLERQAFEATLTVDNGLAEDLGGFTVSVWIKEQGAAGYLSRHTVNALEFFKNEADDLFFFKPIEPDSEAAIDIASGTVGQQFIYRLIPTQDAALTKEGTRYEVGANITYTVGGKEETIEVEPDSILVKPLPRISLEYFLPKSVIADNPNTAITEPSLPFDLGLRVINSGVGNAQNLQIESFQPRIEENNQGLLVEFRILGSEVNGSEVSPSLTVNFGELLAGHAETAAWQMMSTLYGRFIEARATFSHSDELGGSVTSVIDNTSVFRLVGKVDSNNDGIRDFLSVGVGSNGEFLADDDFELKLTRTSHEDTVEPVHFLNLHPSGLQGDGSPDTIDQPVVVNLSGFIGSPSLNGNRLTVPIVGAPGGQGDVNYSFVRVEDPHRGRYTIASVSRDDGSFLKRDNFWRSTELAENSDGTINESADFKHYIDIFDIGNVSGGGTYTTTFTVNYGEAVTTNRPPVIIPLPNLPLLQVGDAVDFTVEAFDPDGDPVELSASRLPADATLTEDSSITDTSRALYDFAWTAAEGISSFSVIASDGVSTSNASITFKVVPSGERLANWLTEHGLDETDLNSDSDFDGYDNLLEFALNLDPSAKSTQGVPRVYVQDVSGEPRLVLECDVLAMFDPDLPQGSVVLTAEVASSQTEGAWASVSEDPIKVVTGFVDQNPAPAPGMVRLRWVDPEPVSDSVSGRTSRFIRLKAEYTPPSP